MTKMKTKQQLKLEIEKLQKQLAELENQIKEISMPKGCRLMRIWEFAKLIESDESDEFLGEFKEQYKYFFLEQTKYGKANSLIARAYLRRDGNWNSSYDDLTGSDDDGQVVFCREKKC